MTRLRRRAWMLREARGEAAEALSLLRNAASTILAMLFGRVPPDARPGVDDKNMIQWRGEIWVNLDPPG